MSNKVNETISITPKLVLPTIIDHSERMDFQLKKLGHRRGLTTPVFQSPPGCGKTSIGLMAEEKLRRDGYGVCAGATNPADIRVPGVDMDKAITKYCGNTEFPFVGDTGVDEESRIIMKWDELFDAGIVVQRIFKQAFDENRIGNLRFPDNTLHVGFTNGLQHGCYSEKLSASFANRLAIYDVLPDPDDFLTWFKGQNLSPELEVLVEQNKDLFYDLDFQSWDGVSNFASFRTTTELAMYFETQLVIHTGDKRVFNHHRDPLLRNKLQAILGEAAAIKVYAFLELMDAVGNIQDLLDNPSSHPIPNDITKKWVIALKLTNEADENNIGAIMTIAERLAGAKSFFESFIAKSITQHRPSLSSHPSIVQWMQRDHNEICDR